MDRLIPVNFLVKDYNKFIIQYGGVLNNIIKVSVTPTGAIWVIADINKSKYGIFYGDDNIIQKDLSSCIYSL